MVLAATVKTLTELNMPTSTPNLNLTKPDAGATNWNTAIDGNFDLLDALFDALTGHDHDGTDGGAPKLPQANTHESADTDSATTALHHTIGTGANQAAAGNHGHALSTLSGQVAQSQIADGAISTSKIADVSVTSGKIATAAKEAAEWNASKLRDRALPSSGGTTGQSLRLAADGTFEWYDPAAGGGGSGNVSTGGAAVTIPTLLLHPDRLNIPSATSLQEWNDSTVGLTWNTTPTVVNANTTVPSALYIRNTTSGEKIGTFASSIGTGVFDIRAKITIVSEGPTDLSCGLLLANTTLNSRLLLNYICWAANNRYWAAQGYTYAGSYAALNNQWNNLPPTLYHRITRDAGNTVRFFISSDGLLWQFIGSANNTTSIDQIGVRSDTPGGATQVAVDWIRSF